MSNDVIISVEGLGKRYKITHQAERQRYTALRDVIAEKAKGLFKKLKGGNFENLKPGNNVSISASQHPSVSSSENFWALKDVSFEVKPGEVVGIIGRNGAGKSTLLKILSRITEPTTGRVHLKGRVASLLEVGTGFHPELTGRENIFLNGAILGMHRAEIKRKFDEIVAFAEVEKFLDTPVKRYSSGMYVRLAFAVAAHLEPEILIVDEVLAVGDAEFQKKCLGKMESVATKEGRTVLFVSHNMGAVTQLCSRVLLIGEGKIRASGSAEEAIRVYTRATSHFDNTDLAKKFQGSLVGKLHFKSLKIESKSGMNSSLVSPSSPIQIEAIGECTEDIAAFRTTLSIFCNGIRLLSMHDVQNAEPIKAGSRFKSSFVLPAYFLRPADYFIALGGHTATEWLWATDLAQFAIVEEWGDNFRSYDTGLINMETRGRTNFNGLIFKVIMEKICNTLRKSHDLLRLVRWLRACSLKRKRQNCFQTYLASTPVRKLQLGSGSNHLPGWLNTDSHMVRTNNAYLNITEAFPFSDRTFNYIFCEHTIEHIHFNQAVAMLSECYRVLLPGGKIRLATPNLEVYLNIYQGGGESILKECTAEIFNSWILKGFYEAKNYRPLDNEPSALFVVNDIFRNYEHKFIYDYQMLAKILAHVGFSDVSESSVGVSPDENLHGLETHNDRINGFLTVVVEARR